MTLSEFATLSTALSGLAVTASLIYLALQTHQNAKHTKALIHQGRITALRELFLARAQADIAAATIIANGGTPTPLEVQRLQYAAICGAALFGWQDAYMQHRSGLLDEDFYRQMCAAVESAMAAPAFRAAWETFRVPGTHFADFIDAIVARVQPAPRMADQRGAPQT
jgi:hypothetical protein